uniref:Ig-like domain-containing protein n=1 Tax=Poecilia formosa TaxID=48698 RepID=A0A087YLK0_POEFO
TSCLTLSTNGSNVCLFLTFTAGKNVVSSPSDQNNSTIKATVGDNVFLPCKDPEQGTIRVVEWSRTDLGSEYVLLYRDKQIDTGVQHPSYKNRADLLVGQMKVGDASLILKNVATDDSWTYECRVVQTSSEKKLISTINLQISPPPIWATALLVLLVLALAAGVSFYFWFRWKPAVLLPFKVPHRLWFCKYRIFLSVAKVEWMDRYNGKVHVYQIGSDQPGEQNQFYRTKMDENLLKTGDLSLTARWPTYEDSGTFTCRVSSRKGDVLMEKQVWLKVKVKQVEVESGEESVLLPWTITEDLDGDVRVEWTDVRDRVVHVYQNGSDQPEEQDQRYRTRTRMDENLLKNKDLSLTLSRPTNGDGGRYTCIVYNKKGDVLMEKQVQLEVKGQWFKF